MIGWKRVVVTVGEKIGSQGLNYSQGGVSQVVTALTILLGDHFGLPVSTTHVLSSGVAGTMLASGSQLQIKTITNIALAWILTLPVCTILSALLYVSGMYFVK
jgi:PiT family inorganic phosphate transporter